MRNEIVCPNCGTPIQIDDATRDSIVKQVRDNEFNEEVKKYTESLKSQMVSEIKLAQTNAKLEMKEEIEKRDAEILRLNKAKEHAVNEATRALFERDKKYNELKDETNRVITKLQEEVCMNHANLESAVAEAVEKERLNNIDKYNELLKAKDEEIDYYKSFKARLSVKLLGESLEEHCLNEFNYIRPLLPNAQFDKDNVISPETRSKGDYIYRELDGNNVEVISIMFEMKNEADNSTHKHKNEDYFKELDKDRTEKKCEYAVLVSMLEPESETYNKGIVDVSHKYEKMYVIRPQFFIPLLTILRGAALNTLGVKEELEKLKNQSVDVSTFESDLEGYKDAIAKCFELASKKKDSAVNNIDKAIALLQKVRDDLTKYEAHEEQANKKANNLTIKKLTNNAPSVAQMIEKVRSDELDVAAEIEATDEMDIPGEVNTIFSEEMLSDDEMSERVQDYCDSEIHYIPIEEDMSVMVKEAFEFEDHDFFGNE